MSTLTLAPYSVTPVSGGQTAPGLTAVFLSWHQRYQQRRQLREMEDWQLQDIGIEIAQARTEADKPFWQA